MKSFPEPIEKLVQILKRLPGIGARSAQRIMFHILSAPHDETRELIFALETVMESIRPCSICGNYTDAEPCAVCSDPMRDKSIICVVEEPNDLLAIERTERYNGTYHVLGGALSPLDGVGPDELNIDSLLMRIREGEIRELILAVNPNITGDATAGYLAKILAGEDIVVTRIAHGIPIGGDLEYADAGTMTKALEGRRELK